MINPEIIYTNIDKFDIYPCHEQVFNKILSNIEENRRILLYGDRFCGKSFFCKKLSQKIATQLDLESIKILDYPLVIMEKMIDEGYENFNSRLLKDFLKSSELGKILDIKKLDLIILDEINSTVFRDLLKHQFEIRGDQILIQVIGIRGLYINNKETFEKLNYTFYELDYPSNDERIALIDKYISISKENLNDELIADSILDRDKYRSLFR